MLGFRRTENSLRNTASGFTLIELLMVIAIVGLLVGLLVPALSKARAIGKQCRELAAAKQLATAMVLYADASKGKVLTGYPTRPMVAGPITVTNAAGERIFGDEAQRYPWRIAPYLNYDFRGLYQSDDMLREIRDNADEYARVGVSYGYVVSLFPSLGMNVAFVGGSERFGAFDRIFQQRFGRQHLERFEDAARPSQLLTFVSARCEPQDLAPTLGRPEGFFRVEPPRFSAAEGDRWESAYDPSSPQPGPNSGFVSLRHPGLKAVAAAVDGHAEMLGWEALRDMQRWANRATGPDWGVGP
jgi:prepilin-type N-terminal cleavage/methylation domain-containing protein